jgi:hypothetical protein
LWNFALPPLSPPHTILFFPAPQALELLKTIC